MTTYKMMALKAGEHARPLTYVAAPDFAKLLGQVFTPGSNVLSVYRKGERTFKTAQKPLQITGCAVPQRNGAFWDSNYLTIEAIAENEGKRQVSINVCDSLKKPTSLYGPVEEKGKVIGVYIREEQSGSPNGGLVERLLLLSEEIRPKRNAPSVSPEPSTRVSL